MRKVLVTGATGFLGQYLIRRLLQENISVRALHRGKKNFILSEEEISKVEWMIGIVLADCISSIEFIFFPLMFF